MLKVLLGGVITVAAFYIRDTLSTQAHTEKVFERRLDAAEQYVHYALKLRRLVSRYMLAVAARDFSGPDDLSDEDREMIDYFVSEINKVIDTEVEKQYKSRLYLSSEAQDEINDFIEAHNEVRSKIDKIVRVGSDVDAENEVEKFRRAADKLVDSLKKELDIPKVTSFLSSRFDKRRKLAQLETWKPTKDTADEM